MYLNTGLILAAQSEAELAGVIAHELGHLAARHSTQVLSRLALGLPLQDFKRRFEFEADRLATQFAHSAGYDPVALADFIDRVWVESSRESRGIGLATCVRQHNFEFTRLETEWHTCLPKRSM